METIINVKELNEVCAKPDRKWVTQTHFNLTNRENVHEIFRYQKFQDDFVENIACVNNGKDFIGSFKPSYEEFLRSIIKSLNLKLPRGYSDNEELTNILIQRINELKCIPDEAWLYNEFPELYKDLKEARKYMKEIEEYKKDPAYSELAKEEEHYFYSCGLRAGGHRRGFDGFVPQQADIYLRFVDRRKAYKELIEKQNFDKFINENYDMDKLAMYLAHKYLLAAEKSPSKRRILSKYNKLLDKYINSSYDKTVTIKVGNEKIDYNNIIERLNKLKDRISKIDGEVPWTLIPEGRRPQYVKAGLDPMTHYMSEEEIEALKKAIEVKEKFYEKNEPLLTAYGTLKYDGYVARIYPNGEVLLDTVCEENNLRKAKGNAMYHMKAIYFDIVSGLDKQVLKKHPQVGTMNHTTSWPERAQKLLENEGTKEEQEQAKQLVKRIIEQNEKDS